tara:strand:- start:579 stop:929 length:351 start_codon:yes stop_codon:yes gene_type:complete
MTNKYWFRFIYPESPTDFEEHQKIKKYHVLQHYSPGKNGYVRKVDRYSYVSKHRRNTIARTAMNTGYNPPGASDVPGKSWNLVVTESIIKSNYIANRPHRLPQTGDSKWEYSTNTI